MAWFTVLMSTAGSAAIASAMTIFVGRSMMRENAQDDTPLSALLICSQLEVYGAACAEIVLEDLSHSRSKGRIGELAARMTPAPDFSPEIRWKALGTDAANELFNFRAQVHAARRHVASLAEDADVVSRECIRQSIGLGLRAFAIARMLRTRHALPPADLGHDWDPAVALAQWHLELSPVTQEAIARDTDRQDRNEAQWADTEPLPFVLASDDSYETPSTHPLFRGDR